MGSIEGIIILSASHQPILHSNFLHPLPNYPLLHADQLSARLQSSEASKDENPISWTEGVPAADDVVVEDGESDESINKEDDDETESGNGVIVSGKAAALSSSLGESASCNVEHNGLRLVATFSKHVDPMSPLAFLSLLLSNLQSYLGSPLTEDALRDNFDTVYQVMEEMLDESGQPLTTEFNALRDIVREPSWVSKVASKIGSTGMPGLGPTLAPPPLVSPIPWRRPISASRYTTNELYIDIEETLRGTFARSSPSSVSQQSEARPLMPLRLQAMIKGKAKLNGTPDVLLRFNNPSLLSEARLHPCIRIKRWKKEGVLSFVPPDGDFDLVETNMAAQLGSLDKKLPLRLHCERKQEVDKQQTTFKITLLSAMTEHVDNIEVLFGVTDASASIETTTSGVSSEDKAGAGTFHYDPKRGMARWSLGRFSRGQRPLSLTGTVTSDVNPCLSTAITCRFAIPLYSIAGLKVSGLEVSADSSYRPYKGVRNTVKGDIDWRW